MNKDDTRLYTCCFFGHRKINETDLLSKELYNVIEDLIINQNVNTFLFGSKSEFNSLCLKVVTKLREKYPYIKRVYVRSAFPDISDSYENYLLENYEKTYFLEKMRGAGKASYVERNQEMINQSNFCVVYYDESYAPPRRRNNKRDLCDYQPKSGTKIAYEYAVKKGLFIINVIYCMVLK